MKFIKYLNLALIIGVVVLFSLTLTGCSSANQSLPPKSGSDLSLEEQRKADLYITVMKAAYHEENGGHDFLAVKLNTLTGLSEAGQQQVLLGLQELSPQVYDLEQVKQDEDKFKLDDNGDLQGSINGTVLWVEVESYKGNSAIISGVSWFGNLGAVFPQYEATYRNGEWQLKLISMAVS